MGGKKMTLVGGLLFEVELDAADERGTEVVECGHDDSADETADAIEQGKHDHYQGAATDACGHVSSAGTSGGDADHGNQEQENAGDEADNGVQDS